MVFTFLPTPSHGGRLYGFLFSAATASISTHALTWRATFGHRLFFVDNHNFYPRPHMEGDARDKGRGAIEQHFYPRPHMEGDAALDSVSGGKIRFLPTPSHGGRLDKMRGWAVGDRISTHALTWRATVSDSRQHHPPAISTHALTWRATCRARRLAVKQRLISTHALTWRATN